MAKPKYQTPDPRGTRAFQKLARQVRAEEPLCWLRLAGCTRLSTTADHVIPFSQRPDLGMERVNLRGACRHCNSSRQAKPVADLGPQAEALDWFN